MATKDWDSLSTKEQCAQLKVWDDDSLARRFGREAVFFRELRTFFKDVPEQTVEPRPVTHSPPKELVVSARRDLSFFEANFELFDNAIDKWRTEGAKKDLHIEINYDLELLKGKYWDDAGGMAEPSVYKVFIPGETTNTDYGQPVIGSFGMGAKKGIFRLSDGAKIVSCTSPKFSASSEVPERWETNPSWETLDGRAKPTKVGTTEIFFFRLFDPPTPQELDDLIRRAGVVYAPLLTARLLPRAVKIVINGVEVQPARAITWSAPRGAAPRVYKFTHTFKNFLHTGSDITLNFQFQCGLTRKQPGKRTDTEPDWGIDVYGNGRLIQPYLKDEFGFGEKNMSKHTQGSKFFRGELFLLGHSFAIPWDTHKREYLRDHPVSRWLREQLRPVIRSYLTIGGNFASNTHLKNTVLQTAAPTEELRIYTLPTDKVPPEAILPKWEYGPRPSRPQRPGSRQEAPADSTDLRNQNDNAVEDEERTIGVLLDPADVDDLLQRFNVDSEDDLGGAIRDCLLSGVAFPLEATELEAALKALRCDDTDDLSERIKEQLLEKVGRSDHRGGRRRARVP